MRYRLRRPFRLRSWKGLPHVVLDVDRLRAIPVSEAEFACLELCDGSVDFDLPAVGADLRQAAADLMRRGLIEACEPGEGLAPEQALRRYPNRYVRQLHWSVTNRCNYRCRHCLMSADATGSEPSLEDVAAIADQIFACGIPAVALTGGEPLVRRDFPAILKLLSRRGILISTISTNGSLVTEGLLDALEELGQRPDFVVSFDGVGHHDWLRGVPGAEAAAERAIRLLAGRDLRVTATMTLHAGNADAVVETALALASWGARELDVSDMCDEGRWLDGEDGSTERTASAGRTLSISELAEALIAAIPAYFEAGIAAGGLPLERLRLGPLLIARASRPEALIIPAERSGSEPDRFPLMRRERLEPYLSADGRLMPSMVLAGTEFAKGLRNLPYPSIWETPLQECLTDSPFLRSVGVTAEDYLRANPACAACPHARRCLGGSRVNAILLDPAHPLAPDPIVCELFREGWIDRARAAATAAARLMEETA